MIKVRFGDLDKVKINNKEIGIDNLGRELLIEFKAKSNCNSYTIKIHSLKNIIRDRRKSFIEIKHNNNETEHIINMVIDFVPPEQKTFHLNLTKDSENYIKNCDECKKYFYKFNHFELCPKDENGVSIIDVDMIWHQLKQNLTDFLQEYNQIKIEDLTFKDLVQ